MSEWEGGRVTSIRLHATGRKGPVHIVIVVQGQPDLLQIVATLRAPGRLAGHLHRRKQQRDQDGNDGDNDQQLDQRKTTTSLNHGEPSLCEADEE